MFLALVIFLILAVGSGVLITHSDKYQSQKLQEATAVVKRDKIMFEVGGVPEERAKEALRKAAHKLPIKCKFVKKEEMGGDN